jgi:hypothetical protein
VLTVFGADLHEGVQRARSDVKSQPLMEIRGCLDASVPSFMAPEHRDIVPIDVQ